MYSTVAGIISSRNGRCRGVSSGAGDGVLPTAPVFRLAPGVGALFWVSTVGALFWGSAVGFGVSVSGAFSCSRAAPHWMQNAAPFSFSVWHTAQRQLSFIVPQAAQNPLAPSFPSPQVRQTHGFPPCGLAAPHQLQTRSLPTFSVPHSAQDQTPSSGRRRPQFSQKTLSPFSAPHSGQTHPSARAKGQRIRSAMATTIGSRILFLISCHSLTWLEIAFSIRCRPFSKAIVAFRFGKRIPVIFSILYQTGFFQSIVFPVLSCFFSLR